MKVTIEERGTFQRPGLVKKVQGVYSLISEKATGEKRKRLETLAKALLTYTPFSYLLTPPEEEILTWLERQRVDSVAV